MDFFTTMERLPRNLAVIGAEILFVIAVCLLLAFAVRLVTARLVEVTSLQPYHFHVQALGKGSRALIVVVAVVLTLALTIWNSVLVYQNTDLLVYTIDLLTRVPANFWSQLGIGLVKILGLVLLVRFLLLPFVRRLLVYLESKTKNIGQLESDDKVVARFFRTLTNAVTNIVWLAVATSAMGLLNLPDVITHYASVAFRIFVIVELGLVLVKAIAAAIYVLDALSTRHAQTEVLLAYYQSIRGLTPLVRRTLEYAVYLGVATLVILQLGTFAYLAVHGPRLIQILGVFLVGRVLIEILKLSIDRSMFRSDEVDDDLEMQRRMTLAPLMKSFVAYLVYFSIFVFALWALNINPMPLLAGAGLVGLIVGLGAQPVINDLVSGFFILLENLFLVGDYIETGTARGTVEAVDIRTTRIRDPNGQQHILRNGQLGAVINYSKNYTFAVVEVGVRHDVDLDQVSQLLQEVGAVLHAQNVDVLEETQVQGVERFSADGPVLRTITRVKPGRHQQVARIYRRLVKEKFDEAGVKLTAT